MKLWRTREAPHNWGKFHGSQDIPWGVAVWVPKFKRMTRFGKSWNLSATMNIKWWWESPGKVDHPVRMLWKGSTDFVDERKPETRKSAGFAVFAFIISSLGSFYISSDISTSANTIIYTYILIYIINLKTSSPFLAVLLITWATLIHEDCTKLRSWPARQQTLAVSNVNPDLIRAHSCIQAHLQSLGSLYGIDQCIHEIAIKCYESLTPWSLFSQKRAGDLHLLRTIWAKNIGLMTHGPWPQGLLSPLPYSLEIAKLRRLRSLEMWQTTGVSTSEGILIP